MTTTPAPTETASVTLDSGPIAYRDLGSGPPVIFVHGFLVDGKLWSDVPDRLAGAGLRCLVPDWPMGSHRTAMDPSADLSPTGMAATIVAFLDALDVDRAIVVGNDSGGAISQILTAHHPDRVERLVLTNCDTFEDFPPFPFSLMVRMARIPGGATAMAAPFRIRPLGRATYGMLVKSSIPADLVEAWMRPSIEDAGIRRDGGKFAAGMDKRYTLEAAEKLRGFERPVRFAWAPEDRFFKLAQAERLAAMLPDAKIEHVADAKTFVSLDQPERLATLIGEFARD